MSLLNDSEIKSNLNLMEEWVFLNNSISKEFLFDDYMSGIQFVNELAKVAEKNNHHPDITIGWCKVTLSFTSHELGGVSFKCMNMAKTVDNLLKA
ncbi:MAG: 4a-hydroxytetrahydrobiopterin dehydratase [Fidelibacterota bacterium]|jgi:4a-hydroxytetrahydrobiopterin dehydratase|nr:4a-hydroxytetrahydrobiopterin dehydratase [Candidatus Neomarinimicrobiota bacterium]|tara:strand:- start:72 stop:356 length:285 start_codon:yes stop_codon:yes gene_type:complete